MMSWCCSEVQRTEILLNPKHLIKEDFAVRIIREIRLNSCNSC